MVVTVTINYIVVLSEMFSVMFPFRELAVL